MGNCSGITRLKERSDMESLGNPAKTRRKSDRRCQSDPPSDISDEAPALVNGNVTSKSTRHLGGVPCRIPVLKGTFTHNSPLKQFRGHKSVLFKGLGSGRVAAADAGDRVDRAVECGASPQGPADGGRSNESGFVSDVSVTASCHSQANGDHDEAERVVVRESRPATPLAGGAEVPMVEVISTRAQLTDGTACRHLCTRNVGVPLKRPQSLSTESEILINKALSKRSSEGSDLLPSSPTATPLAHDSGTVLQDVSSLKLMLHRLKRYLTQDGDDRLPETEGGCLFRLSPPPVVDVSALARDDLEKRYEALLERNANLERLLQSREKVIAQLHREKAAPRASRSAVDAASPAQRAAAPKGFPSSPAVGDSAHLDESEHRRRPRPDVEQTMLHWSSLKLPAGPP